MDPQKERVDDIETRDRLREELSEEHRPAQRRRSPSAGEPRRHSPPPKGKRRRKKKKRSRAPLIIFLVIFTLLAAAAGAGVFYTYKVSMLDTVYPGVTARDTDFSGMTYAQVADTLVAQGGEKYNGLAVTASLPLDNTLTISAYEAGLTYSADALAGEIYGYGRDGSMLENALTYLRASWLHSVSFTPAHDLEVTLNEDAVRQIIAQAAVDIDAQLLESGVEITDTEIRLVKGASGLTLDEEAVFTQFRDALLRADASGFAYDSSPQADEEFDFQALHDEMYAQMVNARIVYAPEYAEEYARILAEGAVDKVTRLPNGQDKISKAVVPELTDPQPGDEDLDFQGQPFLVTQSAVGVDFDVAAAQSAWEKASYGESVAVPLQVTKPEHSTEEIEAMLFADPLSKNWTMVRLYNRDYCNEVRTSLAGSTKFRISNVKKACGLIDGVMLMPGETFGYNEALGERTDTNGWLPAPAYANGEVRQEYGGGICQVSSTLYNAALYANLEIVERECHQFQVGYLPAGMDATVSWGWPNFRFRNDKNFPIKIHAWVDDTTNECCVQILGTDVEHQFVIMRFAQWKRYDESGEHVDANGNGVAIGTEASTWRVVYNDGDDYNDPKVKPVSETYEAYSKYNYHSEDIA